jgi:hypothetical protein
LGAVAGAVGVDAEGAVEGFEEVAAVAEAGGVEEVIFHLAPEGFVSGAGGSGGDIAEVAEVDDGFGQAGDLGQEAGQAIEVGAGMAGLELEGGQGGAELGAGEAEDAFEEGVGVGGLVEGVDVVEEVVGEVGVFLEAEVILEAAFGPGGEVVWGEVGGGGTELLDDVGGGKAVGHELVELVAEGQGEAGDFAVAAAGGGRCGGGRCGGGRCGGGRCGGGRCGGGAVHSLWSGCRWSGVFGYWAGYALPQV